MAVKLKIFKNGGMHLYGKKRRFTANPKLGKAVSVSTPGAKVANGIYKVAGSAGIKSARPKKGTYSRLPKV